MQIACTVRFALLIRSLACLCFVIFPVAVQASQEQNPKRVTLNVDKVRFRDALEMLFDQVGASYVLEQSVAERATRTRVTFHFTNASFRASLEMMIRETGLRSIPLTYRIDSGVYLILFRAERLVESDTPARPPNNEDLSQTHVTLDMTGKSLPLALKTLFKAVNASYLYTISEIQTQPVSLSADDIPLDDALKRLLGSCSASPSLTYRQEQGIFTIWSDLRLHPGIDPTSTRVTLRLQNVDLRYAIGSLMRAAGANFTMDPVVQGRVTAVLKDVSFRTALESLLRSTLSTRPMTYRIENGVYNIVPQAEDSDGFE